MNRNQKNNIIMIVGFLLLAVGLFAYQNFIMPAQQLAQRAVVYVAGQDLADETVINKDDGNQFKAIQVTEDSVLPGSITNIDSVDGKVIEGGLLEGELLTSKRIVDESSEKGDLYVKIEPDYPVDIRDGENVSVYVRGYDEAENQDKVVLLFEKKQVHESSRVTSLIEGESSQGYYLRLTQEELKDYYLAKNKGSIIVAKIDPAAGDITDVLQTKDSLEDLQELPVEEQTDNDGALYEVGAEETFETVAFDNELSVSDLREANPGITELEAGMAITIPDGN